MTQSTSKKFLALYLVPVDVMEDWAKTDQATRKLAEEKMRADWDRWMREHLQMIVSTNAAGKTKAVTAGTIVDSKNDIMLYSIVEAESHEAAAKAFALHPHLSIPRSSIEVTEIRAISPG